MVREKKKERNTRKIWKKEKEEIQIRTKDKEIFI